MGSLDRRADRLEEQAELRRQAEQHAAESDFREALTRVSTEELRAMNEHFQHTDSEGWREEDEPLMRRLLGLVTDVRCEREAVRYGRDATFPWQVEMREERRGYGDEPADEGETI